MATIMLIVIEVISLLGKLKELMHDVFWVLAAGREHSMFFFPPKKPKMSAKRGCPDDADVFLDNVAWAIRSTYHTVLKASPGAAIFGQDMLFDIPFVADWCKFGEQRQSLTDCGNQHKNAQRIAYDYKVGD
jgi:hypothetical protein